MNRKLIKGYAEKLNKLAKQVSSISKDLSRDVFEEELSECNKVDKPKLLEENEYEQLLLIKIELLKCALSRIENSPLHITAQGSILMHEGGIDIATFCHNTIQSVENFRY